MSTTTERFGLLKPALTDPADITQMNRNWDIIDENLNNIPITSEVPSDAEMWIDPDDVSADEAHITSMDNPHNVTCEQIGAATMEYVKKAYPVNILDNSDWTNPVNQRGQDSYSSSTKEVYTIDRWKAASNNLTDILFVEDGYVTLNYTTGSPWIKQYFEANTLTVGKAYTIAVWLVDGTVGAASAVIPAVGAAAVNTPIITGALRGKLSHNAVELLLWSGTLDIKYVALFEGEYTAETLPEYHPKGYGAELAECQRYYQKVTSTELAACHKMVGNSYLVIPLSIKYPMRIDKPTITGSIEACSQEGWMTGKVPTLKNTITGFVVNIPTTATGYTFENGKSYLCRGTIELSADL